MATSSAGGMLCRCGSQHRTLASPATQRRVASLPSATVLLSSRCPLLLQHPTAQLERRLARRLVRGPTRAVQLQDAPPATERNVLSLSKWDDQGITIEVAQEGDRIVVDVRAREAKPRMMHWAVDAWKLPPQSAWPQGTVQIDEKAVQSPFQGGDYVRLVFEGKGCPNRLVFVLKETEPENWVNAGGGDFSARLTPPSKNELSEKLLKAEGEYTHWGLFNRLCMANEVLDEAEGSGVEGMAYLFTWLRLSSLRLLDWYRNSNYQSKDLAHVQKTIAQRLAEKASNGKYPLARLFSRLALAGLPRGGGNGDDIRMGILHVMRAHGIREGHRPGIECRFLEQWHQKLHTNTTPEDIIICEAYLAFLGCGDPGAFWGHLWHAGSISRQMLAEMDHPITADPLHLPQLHDSMQHYLWILKTTHAGADLDTMMEMCKGLVDDDLRWNLFDVLNNRHEWWVPGKICDLRKRLRYYVTAEGASRDLALLDIALDGWFRTRVEGLEKSELGGDELVDLTALVLDNASIAAESEELAQCAALWCRLRDSERWGSEWVLQALAAAQRSALSLGDYCDTIYNLVQPAAEAFQRACSIEEASIVNFGEEVVRGQAVFVLSPLLRYLEPVLRKASGLPNWLVVSGTRVAGVVEEVGSLADIQGRRYERPTVIVTNQVGGNEDIPAGVSAVLSRTAVDVLSHVALRARAQGVLLAACVDDAEFEGLRGSKGKHVALSVGVSGSVVMAPADEHDMPVGVAAAGRRGALVLPKPAASTAWAVRDVDLGAGTAGGKSRNLVELRGRLPDWVQVPSSICLPFGTFERTLAHAANREVAGKVQQLRSELASHNGNAGVPACLTTIRDVVMYDLVAPEELRQQAGAAAAAAGLVSGAAWRSDNEWAGVWKAICQVWASKWNERAWLSRQASGVPEDDLVMACLIQQVVRGEYAYVLHTADPLTGQAGRLYGEVVCGLGETLVGNYPGQALSFAAGAGEGVQARTFPSKRVGLFAPPSGSLIVRSDSNGEDLEGFAGAGLYDSVLVNPPTESPLDYASERLVWDAPFRDALLEQLSELGRAVESAAGGRPQDIEGVWSDGKLTVVQARAQVVQ